MQNYGVQMFSLRDLTSTDMEAAFAAVSRIGYKYIESAGFFGHGAEEVKTLLDKYGLKICSSHTNYKFLLPEAIEETIKFHKEIENPNIIIPGADYSTPEALDKLVSLINFAQERLAKEGITLGYHNHYGEFLPTSYGAIVHSELEKRTNVEFEIDTYWAFFAGKDPVAILDRLDKRIRSIHIKDGITTPDGKSDAKSLGEGDAPVAEVWKKAAELGKLMIVESEGQNPDGPAEITRCFEFLKKIDR